MISREELYSIFKEGVKIGVLSAMKAASPADDYLKEKDVMKWCKANYADFQVFKKLRDEGFLHDVKRGRAKNSPIYYSKAEISTLLSSERVLNMLKTAELSEMNEKNAALL